MSENATFALATSLFLIAFPLLWLVVTALLGRFSGWHELQDRFPDRDEPPIDRLRMQSGVMGRGSLWNPWGGVSYGGCLRFDVCRSGLRIAVWRIFGPFARPFFVPWPEIAVEQKRVLWLRRYRLEFRGTDGRALTVSRRAFKRIAASSPLELPA